MHGARGPDLIVLVTKNGYYTSKAMPDGFIYTPGRPDVFHPDPLNPVVFHLRKKGKAEPLIVLNSTGEGGRDYGGLGTNGAPLEISFYTGKRVAQGGQFTVQYWMKPPQNRRGWPFEWHCKVTVPGGGLQSTTEEFPFTAPVQGYQPSIEIDWNPNAWQQEIKRLFYVHLPDGRYGLVKFELYNSYRDFFCVDVLINPTGSRNLEYDMHLPGNIMVDQSSGVLLLRTL
ncbi:MAG: hypothetical protein KGR98_03695 [Verrucomicrobia bacterium]|nr:hypothetical protein [Verrucomicrobiota bacterium]